MLTFWLSFIAGALSTLSPCVLPVLPIIVGSALQKHKQGPIVVASGLVLSFALLGIFAGLGVQAFEEHRELLRYVGGGAMILVGLTLSSRFARRRLSELLSLLAARSAQNQPKPGTAGGVLSLFMLGAGLGVVWAPCSGPMLAGALALAAASGTRLRAFFQLSLFGVGAAVPLLIAAYATRSLFKRLAPKALAFGRAGTNLFAAALLVMGSLVVSGLDKKVEAALLDSLPDSVMDAVPAY